MLRRYFLGSLVLSLLAIRFRSIPGPILAKPTDSYDDLLWRLGKIFSERNSAELLGREYLRHAAQKHTISTLMES